jgi:hypothetical protein
LTNVKLEDEEPKLAGFLADWVIDRASGRADSECLWNTPSDVYFIGNLRPENPEDEPVFAVRELVTKLSPSAIGCEIGLASDNGRFEAHITLSWLLYYRAFPTYKQQRTYQVRTTAAFVVAPPTQVRKEILSPDGDSAADEEPLNGRESPEEVLEEPEPVTSKAKDALAPRFKKILCSVNTTISGADVDGHLEMDLTPLQDAVEAELRRAQAVCRQDSERIRCRASEADHVEVPSASLESEKAYTAFLSSLNVEVEPSWHLRVEADSGSRLNAATSSFSIQVVNDSPSSRSNGKRNPNRDHFVFDPIIEVEITRGEPRPFILELAPRGFRYDRNLWGRGFNCAVVQDKALKNRFATSHAPLYEQPRYSTNTEPSAAFNDLAKDPLVVLERIAQAMDRYSERWELQRQRYIETDPGWEQSHGTEFDIAREDYRREIEGFKRGVSILSTNKDALLAFKLTNEAFTRGPKTSWRLFQIVFFVMQLAGLVDLQTGEYPEERRIVDIIYFPTGGGKTEAYLAVIVFHCFFDRLRGKTAGVTAWTRFPLRLLTLQQTQRVADVITAAEIVRREQSDLRLIRDDVDPFSVGYFVGQGGSPNQLIDPTKTDRDRVDDQVNWAKAMDPVIRQQWKRVAKCPSCRTNSVTVDFDAVSSRLLHRCANSTCKLPNAVIPVVIVDNELYRTLPSVIVGTIDKLAGLGNQRKMAQLFGQIDGKCSVHGYYKLKCCQDDCTNKKLLKRIVPGGISGPTLFVQDELHLLKEGLGTFDGHYETFTQELLREFGNATDLKIIASSATIEAFERQVLHLYGRGTGKSRVFPGLGPSLAESFYARTHSYPQRIYVGLIPHNKTIFNAILEVIEYYHRAIDFLITTGNGSNPYGGALVPGTEPWADLLDSYKTSLTYFLANRQLNEVKTDLIGHVIPSLELDQLIAPSLHELTGSTSTDDVQNTLELLEKTSDQERTSDIVLATSMVSHGVDVDRLNAMIFYGMPRQNAEYIQASSRVGRAHVGVVFNCLHPARERDQSHFAYFAKYHEFLGRLVEPVAINRWAKFSLNRTAPGLFMAVLLQVVANRDTSGNPGRYYTLNFIKKKISSGEITIDQFLPILRRAYLLTSGQNGGEEGASAFDDELRRLVAHFFDQIIGSGADIVFVSDALIPKPMRSLRDVDEPVEIELDSSGSEWGRRMSSMGRSANGR